MLERNVLWDEQGYWALFRVQYNQWRRVASIAFVTALLRLTRDALNLSKQASSSARFLALSALSRLELSEALAVLGVGLMVVDMVSSKWKTSS